MLSNMFDKTFRKGSSFCSIDGGVKCRVQTAEGELEFNIHPTTTGKQLFEEVTETLGLHESWFFGLQYKDSHERVTWIELDKKILRQIDVPTPEKPPTLQLCVKFYPEDVNEFIQESTVRMFYLQTKEQILSDTIFCPAEESILLASFATQVKFGDFNDELYNTGCLNNERLIPTRILRQYRLTEEEWEDKVIELWKNHRGKDRAEAMVGYMERAQELDMYGISFFEIQNKKATRLFLGVHALGLNVYEHSNQLTPLLGFQWSEIHIISCNGTRFTIKQQGKKTKDFTFVVPLLRTNQDIFFLCKGNHELYKRRRQPDTLEIKQLKQEVSEMRSRHQSEYEHSLNDSKMLDSSEAQKHVCKENLDHMREEMRQKDQEILAAHERIRSLESQVAELNTAREELKEKEAELMELNRRLRFEHALSQDERARLLNKISKREQEITRMKKHIDSKTQETSELERSINEFAASSSGPSFREDKSTDVQQPSSSNLPPEHYASSVNRKLQLLSKELDMAKNVGAATDKDLIHAENKRKKLDRRSIFELVNSGNTRRRIDQFENM